MDFLRRFLFSSLLLPGALFCEEDLSLLRKELQQKTSTPSKESYLEVLNVSYDPTREFYREYNSLFIDWWKKKTGQNISVIQSHGGSSRQAQAIISGLEADITTLALSLDIDHIQKSTGLVGENWQDRLPHKSSPYFSTIVFVVRKGNPKNIKDWNDLLEKNVSIITSNPKTSGGAKWSYLAAYGWFLEHSQHDLEKTNQQMEKFYTNTLVLDTGARNSTTTFIQRKMGDVLVTWENEALLLQQKSDKDIIEIIYPSMSIRAEPPVAWLEKVIEKKDTQDVAHFYLKYLYSSPAQELITKHHFRPYDELIRNQQKKFPEIKMFTIDLFGGWEKAHEIHFRDGGLFDKIYEASKKN